MVQKRGFRKKERKKRKAAIPIKYKAKKKKKSLGNRITGPGPVVNVFPRPIAIFLGQGANWLNRTRLPPKTRIVEKQTALLVVVDFLARYQSLILATNLQMVTIFSHLAIFHPTFSRGVNNNIVSSRIFLEGKDREEESIFRRVAGGIRRISRNRWYSLIRGKVSRIGGQVRAIYFRRLFSLVR